MIILEKKLSGKIEIMRYLLAICPQNNLDILSVVIEHGGSGASTAAPIARDVFKFIKDTI